MGPARTVRAAVLDRLAFSAYDLPTRDKVPLLQELMRPAGEGLALDVGIGTGYTTYSVFGERATVSVDLDPANLQQYRTRLLAVPGARRPLCVVARADGLPFKPGTFRFALCSEVLEHLEDDGGTVSELARVLAPGGRLVVTVPYTGLGFTSFLELGRIRTVHEFPGPEHHVRPGYNESGLRALLESRGLVVERVAFYLRFFTRLTVDLVSLAHLSYQRIVYRRRAWTWAEAQAVADRPIFRLYRWLFGGLRTVCGLDRLIAGARGFGLVVLARRPELADRAGSDQATTAASSGR
jgi:SAM-dependent methyltransferase